MIVQAVIAPLTAGSPYALAERVYLILLVFGYGSILIPVAFYGWTYIAIRDLRKLWWVPAGGLILGLQVLFVDLDGSTDVLPWLAFVALGVAITVERVITRKTVTTDRGEHTVTRLNRDQWVAVAVVAVVVLLVLSGLVWHFGSPYPQSTLQTMQQEAEPEVDPLPITPDDADVPSMQTIYWEQMEPEVCHYRLSWNEVRWIAITDDQLNAQECDGWPDRAESSRS